MRTGELIVELAGETAALPRPLPVGYSSRNAGLQAVSLLSFLRQHEADTIYLVGDIVDFWRVKRGPCWAQSHDNVMQKLLRMVRKGARLRYLNCGDWVESCTALVETATGELRVIRWQDECAAIEGHPAWAEAMKADA